MPEVEWNLPNVLLAALEHTRASACITTAELDRPGPTIVYVNPAYCSMTGRSRTDVIGSTPRIMQGPLTDRAELDRLRTDLAAGRPFEGETVNYRADGTPFIISWRIDPIRDDDGVTTHFVATQEDVTELRRAQRLLDAEQRLDDALTTTLTSDLDVDAARQRIVDTICRAAAAIAAAGTVHVTATVDDGEYSATASVSTRSGSGADPAADLVNRLERPEFGMEGLVRVTDLDDDERSFVDHWGLSRFCRRASTVLGALVEFQRQRRTALRLQQDLLPEPPAAVAGVDLATVYEPGVLGVQVGGDWFDVSASGDRIIVSVGDVSGSGVDAAALMGRLRLLAEVEFRRGAATPAVFDLLDSVCARARQFATMLAVEIQPATGETLVWSAGHLPPVKTDASGASLVDLTPTPPLGHLGGVTPTPTPCTLPDGSGLLLFTDGLVERRGESLQTGLDRLASTIGTVTEPEAIMTAVDDLLRAASDDVAALAVRRVAAALGAGGVSR